MSKIIEASTEIARSPQEVFDYVADATRLPEWQPSVEEAVADPPGLLQVGMTGREVRRVPGGRRTFRWEVTESDPGRRWGLRGIDGPVRLISRWCSPRRSEAPARTSTTPSGSKVTALASSFACSPSKAPAKTSPRVWRC